MGRSRYLNHNEGECHEKGPVRTGRSGSVCHRERPCQRCNFGPRDRHEEWEQSYLHLLDHLHAVLHQLLYADLYHGVHGLLK